jgi:hypothetical protein
MSEHEHERIGHGYEHERIGPERIPYRGFPHRFLQRREYEFGYRGYRLPPTREEEVEILEKWKTKIEEAKTKMDKKLARIEQRIEELKKEA